MWYFQSAFDENRKFLILPGKDYVVGRQDCDIPIEYDVSVSRKHAVLSVSHSEANVTNVSSVNKRASLILKDVSKFGSYVNNQKIEGEHILQDGDEVRCGTPKSIHRVMYEPFIVCTSCVDGAGKKELRSLVCQFGGHVASDWRNDCRLLVMKSVTVTIKVVCALVSLKPIVTVDFLRDLLSFYQGKRSAEPKHESYLPPVTERLVEPGVSFQVNAKRSSVFLGMSFYFLSNKQFQKMQMAVEQGGGVPILWNSPQEAEENLEALLEDKAVVMNPASSEQPNQAHTEWVEKVRGFLSTEGRVMVQDAEIGYSALYASTDTYCNPHKDVSHLLPGGISSQSLHTQAASLSSQIVTTRGEGTQQKPAFKKPQGVDTRPKPAFKEPQPLPAAGSGRETTSASGKTEPEMPGSEPNRDHKLADEKESKVFNVSESLAEETLTVKSEICGEDDDDGTRPSESRAPKSKRPAVVKVEDQATCAAQPSESLPDIFAQSASAVKDTEDRKDRKPVFLLDDEDDDIVHTRKPPPSKSKRRLQKPSEEEDPFDLISRKRPRKATSPAPEWPESGGPERAVQQKASSPAARRQRRSASPVPQPQLSAGNTETVADSLDEEDVNPVDFDVGRSKKPSSHDPPAQNKRRTRRSPSPAPTLKKEKASRRSPSPRTEPQSGPASRLQESGDSDSELPAYSGNERSSSQNMKSSRAKSCIRKVTDLERSREPASAAEAESVRQLTARSPVSHSDSPSSAAAVPEGFLTTRRPLEDQVPVNPAFEKENIDTPAMVVKFEDLVHRPSRRPPAPREDQSGVPPGMTRWRGKLVPNFKKFTKTKYAGADRLPKIIGGRDLEEHSRSANKTMDDWLKDLTEAESEQQEREREAQRLFDLQPTARGRKARR